MDCFIICCSCNDCMLFFLNEILGNSVEIGVFYFSLFCLISLVVSNVVNVLDIDVSLNIVFLLICLLFLWV